MIWRLAALLFLVLCSVAQAQLSGGMMFPGPGTAHTTGGGGCTINGSLDFSGSSSCNMIFYMTGVIQ